MIEIGKEYYIGLGNGTYGTFAKVKILKQKEITNKLYYEFEIIENYASFYEDGFAKKGDTSIANWNYFKKDFEIAERMFMSEMGFKERSDIIKYIFGNTI